MGAFDHESAVIKPAVFELTKRNRWIVDQTRTKNKTKMLKDKVSDSLESDVTNITTLIGNVVLKLLKANRTFNPQSFGGANNQMNLH